MSTSTSGELPFDHSVLTPERSEVVTPSVQVRATRPSDNDACVPSLVATALPLLAVVVAADAAAGASARQRQATTSALMPRRTLQARHGFQKRFSFRG